MKFLEAEDVLLIHEDVINKHELQGLAGDKSLDSVIERIENRIQYGLIKDDFDLAANYAVVIAVGHLFNDANKRTVFRSMDICLRINGIELTYDTTKIGNIIIKVAQKLIDERELASYLRPSNLPLQQQTSHTALKTATPYQYPSVSLVNSPHARQDKSQPDIA